MFYRVCLFYFIGRNVFVLVVLYGFFKIEERWNVFREFDIVLCGYGKEGRKGWLVL